MTDVEKVSNTIDKMICLLAELKEHITGVPNSTVSVQSFMPSVADDLGNFESLKKAVFSDKWPEAVNSALICDPNSEEDKSDRGRGVIELLIEEDLKGMKFLDYGCGEGHCVVAAGDYKPHVAVGYDSKHYDCWSRYPSDNNVKFTDNIEDVRSMGQFDIITLFDVLDHVVGEGPSDVLKNVHNLLKSTGKVYMRVHPFSSRHGTHLYHELNKAFLHLVFTENELDMLVPDSKYKEPSIKIVYPIKSYNDMIESAGFVIESRRDITEKVETFFKIPKIAERIMKNTGSNFFPDFQMSLCFLDYKLSKK